MPLDKSGSKASVGNNIRTELAAGKKRSQAIAIALDVARRAQRSMASGGNPTQATPWYVRHEAENMMRGPKIGGTGIAPINVNPNPAGMTPVAQALKSSPKVGAVKTNFPKLPKPPTMTKPPKLTMKDGGRTEAASRGLLHGPTPGRADKINTTVRDNSFIIPAHVVSALGEGNTMAGAAKLDKMFPPIKSAKAKGGKTGHVKVALSDGEYRLEPEHVLEVGKGNMARGHRLLKIACEHITNKTVEHLKHMPKPVDSGDD